MEKINIQKFPYGKPSKSLRKAVIWLNRRKKSFWFYETNIDDQWRKAFNKTRVGVRWIYYLTGKIFETSVGVY